MIKYLPENVQRMIIHKKLILTDYVHILRVSTICLKTGMVKHADMEITIVKEAAFLFMDT